MSGPPGVSALLHLLEEGGATHLVGLPDSVSGPLLDLALARGRPAVVPVTREGEAFAVASGLWLGGATPVVIVQNSGLLESGDALRGTAARMGVPLLVLVTWRGYAGLVAARSGGGAMGPATQGPAAPPFPTRDDLVRPEVDSVAILTLPTLMAWGIPHGVWSSSGDGDPLRDLWARARREKRPVAMLLPRRLD